MPSSRHVATVGGKAALGNHERRYKTRFPSAGLSRRSKEYAKERGFEPAQIANMFEHFRNWNIAIRSYSADWREAWFNWVDREVTIDTEQYHKRRAREYWEATA
jgi:hypothetical protein